MNIEKLSDKKLYALYEKLDLERSKLADEMIALGLGNIPINTLFKDFLNFEPVLKDLKLFEKQSSITAEAERRYGHDGLFVLRYK